MINEDKNPLTKPIAYPKQFLISEKEKQALLQEDKVATIQISGWLTKRLKRDEKTVPHGR